MICHGCGGIVGRDCFNPQECEQISRDMEARAAVERAMYQRGEQEYFEELEADRVREQEEEYDMMRLDAAGVGLA